MLVERKSPAFRLAPIHVAPAGRTRTSHAAYADWERTPTLKKMVGAQERSILTLRSIERGHNVPSDLGQIHEWAREFIK